MNEKTYIENYVPYQQPTCLNQMASDTQNVRYSYTNFPLSNTTLSPTANFMDVCNVPSQNISFHQNNQNSISIQQEQSDLLNWEAREMPDGENVIKTPDKIDTIQISNKDLSPSSYSNNIDLILSESCKQSMTRDLNYFNKFESEWYYNQSGYNYKNTQYTACAQEKFSKCYGTQKNQEIDFMMRSYNYNEAVHDNTNTSCRTNNKNVPNDNTHDYTYNYYDNKCFGNQSFTQNDNYFSTNANISFETTINHTDQQTECSNESDIIVEESDEEITDYTDDNEKQLAYQINKCLICNVLYKPLGTQFYFLTAENPLTMFSQKPVIQKLINIIGSISTTRNYLCSECLGLVNNIDHLEKLKTELIMKFKRTCLENQIEYRTKTTQLKTCIKKMPKYKCKLCKKILCLKKYCLYHLKRHKNRGFLCDSCGKVYPNKKNFSLHRIQHKKRLCEKIDSFMCVSCNKSFRTKSHQKEHQNYCLGTLPYKCKYQHCDKKFPSPTKLKNHIKFKHDKKFTVICSICNIGFIKISDYKNHIVSHSVDKKFSCQKCNKTYKTLSNLNFHMKIHGDRLPFSCQICKKGFMRKEYLEAHTNNHNGIKNFSCTSCDKKFVSQKNLDAHLKYHEGTVKKNTCNICGKTMASGFEEHLRIHNNLREFECEHCDMKFNTKGTLSKHVKKKHI